MIELLESRIAPAGIVSISVKAGVLSISAPIGDADAQTITITNPAPGSFTITPDAGTQLKLGSAAALDAGTALTLEAITSDLSTAGWTRCRSRCAPAKYTA